MKLILLPGLDGTGNLFRQFIHALPPEWEPQVVCYPATGDQSYATLLAYVRHRLPLTETFCLLAESFSGPLAYAIATEPPPNLQTVIFIATFLSNPRPLLLRWRRWLPLQWKMPDWVVRRFLLGMRADQSLITEFWKAVAANDTRILHRRLTAIATLPTAHLEKIAIPCIYLQASTDWLVPNHSIDAFRQCCKRLNVHQVVGTHFLLQSSPVECAQIVQREFQEIR